MCWRVTQMKKALPIFSIGHSVHTKGEFIKMLHDARIDILVDVRAFPASKKHPHFKKEIMKDWLSNAGIDYQHFPLLGGRRPKSPYVQDELNGAWENQSFHNYADYTLTAQFREGIDALQKLGTSKRVAYCCAERHPSRCHRLLISNWLAANGWYVQHIIDLKDDKVDIIEHEQGRWGAMPIIEKDGTVVYPKY